MRKQDKRTINPSLFPPSVLPSSMLKSRSSTKMANRINGGPEKKTKCVQEAGEGNRKRLESPSPLSAPNPQRGCRVSGELTIRT